MSVTAVQIPNLVSLADDPVIVHVLTNTHLEAGAKEKAVLTFDYITAIPYMQLWYTPIGGTGVEALTFNFVDALATPTDILKRVNFTTDADWYTHIVTRLTGIFELAFIQFTATATGLIAEAKQYGPCVINFIEEGFFTVVKTEGEAVVFRENYTVGIRVYDAEWNLMGADNERPDVSGFIKFNISDYVSSLPVTEFHMDEDPAKLMYLVKNSAMYKFFIFEQSGYPPVEESGVWSDPLFVLYGKSSFIKLGIWHEEIGSFYNELVTNKRFLSLQPNHKRVSPFQPEKLFYFVYDTAITELVLHLNIKFTDGTSQIVNKGSIEAVLGQTIEVVTSPQVLDVFNVNTAKTVHSYEVSLRLPGSGPNYTIISEVRNYVIDYETYDYLRFFIFRNDYGGAYEVLRSTGKSENIGKIAREFAINSLPDDWTTKNRREVQTKAERTIEFVLRWGLLRKMGTDTRAWKNYMQQIELSNEVFEWINGYLVSCSFITDDYDLHTDNRTIYTHTSAYRRAFVDEAYSNDDIPVIGDYSDDYNEDYFV